MTLWEEFAGHTARQPDKVAIVSHRTADGSMTTLLKHITVFNYLLAVLTGLEPVMSPDER